MTQPRPTPPRGTTRVPAGTRPPDQHECSGCGELIARTQIACKPCWRTVPGEFKERLGKTAPGSAARKRVITEMRSFLRGAWLDRGPNFGGNAQ